jgi:predicted phosphodiesterase
MRALLIGDIHTEAELLKAALALGAEHGVDRVLCVGDIVDGPGDPLACIAQLRASRAEVVAGNHERWVVEGTPLEPFHYPEDAIDWIAALPATREYATPAGRVLLGHGLGADDMARLEPDTDGYALECLDSLWALIRAGRFRYLVGGHTHCPMVRTVQGLTVINPGTLVMTQEPGVMLADFARGEFERYALLPKATRVADWRVAP